MRYIPYQEFNPHTKNALNNVLINSVQETKESIFWLCGWSKDAVNISRGQRQEEVVNTSFAKQNNIEIVRRQGGGGAVYLKAHSDIAWHIIAPNDFFPNTLQEKYEFACNKLINILKTLGIESYYKPLNDVRTKKGKISGSTLKKKGDVTYLGGTLIFKCEKHVMNQLLTPEKDTFKKDVPERMKYVCGVTDFKRVTREKVLEAFEKEFLVKDYKTLPITKKEYSDANG